MKSKKKRTICIAVIIIFLLILSATILFIIFNNKNQKTENNMPDSPKDTHMYPRAANESNETDTTPETDNSSSFAAPKGSTQDNSGQIEDVEDDKSDTATKTASQQKSHPSTQSTTTTTSPQPIFQGITTMQAMTPEVCASEPTPSSTTITTTNMHQNGIATAIPQTILKDTRDDKSYYIRKLADGNCWMAQNLAFNNSKIYPENSDTTVEVSISSGYIKVNGWELSPVNTNLCLNDDGTVSTCNTPETTANLKKAGYYYNYATWGATSTVCPKGWTIPDITSSNGWEKVKNSYNGNIANLSNALNLIKTGHLKSGWSEGIGGSGRYVVRYRDGFADSNLYSFYSNTGTIGSISKTYDRNYYAFWESIRCVNK